MLRTITRLVKPQAPLPPRDWSAVQAWADAHGHEFKREKEDRGFAVTGQVVAAAPMGSKPWRLEWGPSQREYIVGPELRIRVGLGLPPELQMLFMPLGLMDSLERETFARFAEQSQTEVDLGMPEEMRWLALSRRVPLTPWKALRDELGAVAAIAGTAEAWLQDTSLQHALLNAVQGMPAFVLMTSRGRLYLRRPLDVPDAAALDACLALMQAAVPALHPVLDAIGRRADSGFPTSSIPGGDSPD